MRLKNKHVIVNLIAIIYTIWFMISFAVYFATKPLDITGMNIVTISQYFTSIYNFNALATVGLILLLLTREEKVFT